MSYMDSFVLQLPVEKLPAYRRMTRKCGKKWMEHDALAYTECLADEVKPGKLTSVKLKPGETVVLRGSSMCHARIVIVSTEC
jgi:uncharacterized protein YbaA (DUF1428 family)